MKNVLINKNTFVNQKKFTKIIIQKYATPGSH